MASDIDNHPVPTRLSAAIFHAKATLLQTRRGLVDIAAGIRRHQPVPPEPYRFLLAESRTPLWDSVRTVRLDDWLDGCFAVLQPDLPRPRYRRHL